MPLDIFQIQLTTYISTVELWSRVGPRNIVEPLNAAVLAIIPEKRPNSAALLARSYTVTAVQVEAQSLAKMRTLPGQDVLLHQPHLVATGEFLGTVSRAEFSGL